MEEFGKLTTYITLKELLKEKEKKSQLQVLYSINNKS
jgi:hypothetical protein